MTKFITCLAAGLVLATASVATAAPPVFGHPGQAASPSVRRYSYQPRMTAAPAPATAQTPAVRRFSYEPGMTAVPAYRTYRYVRPTTPRYLLPKSDVRRFST